MRRLVIGAVGILLVAGCAQGTAAPTNTQAALELAYLTKARPMEATVVEGARASDDQLLKAGYVACRAMKDGRLTRANRAGWMITNSAPGVVTAVGAAESLCPDWYKG